jgi:hypothetical protein
MIDWVALYRGEIARRAQGRIEGRTGGPAEAGAAAPQGARRLDA